MSRMQKFRIAYHRAFVKTVEMSRSTAGKVFVRLFIILPLCLWGASVFYRQLVRAFRDEGQVIIFGTTFRNPVKVCQGNVVEHGSTVSMFGQEFRTPSQLFLELVGSDGGSNYRHFNRVHHQHSVENFTHQHATLKLQATEKVRKVEGKMLTSL